MPKLHRSRAPLCSTLAIATALTVGVSPAAGQALLGTVTSSTGVGTITTGPGSTVIPVTAPQAVINWDTTGPSSGALTTFSNAGSTTSFTGQTNFAILNRVTPTIAGNSIFMGGNINSLINGQIGGTVYFYSPNGIVVGGNATINVGSLGLTTLPISDVRGVWMSGFGASTPQVAFGAATNAASVVRTQASSGGAIVANGPGNYIALVAPRVEHRGIIRTDSGAALVAAGAATITFNPSGLYDIAVSTGSTDANGVVVDGGQIQRNSAAIGPPHRAYLVSVPANNAMTMVVQGGARLGFDIAGSAAIEGNAVVLSAGRDVSSGSAAGAPIAPASASIDNATIGSNLVMDATASARISTSNGATALTGDVALTAPGGIIVAAQNHRLSIGGSLNAVADKLGGDGVGGAIIVAAQNGQTLAVGGNTLLSANGRGASAVGDRLNAGNGTGGQINLQSTDGGAINIGGALGASVSGTGGGHDFSNGNAGSGTGGTANIHASGGNSVISVGGVTTLAASGTGGSATECSTCLIGGGNGAGGAINVNGSVRAANTGANRLDFIGGLSLVAQGTGGAGDATAGVGRGGAVRLVTSDGTIVNGRLGFVMAAGGFGGAYLGNGVGNGGSGSGGDVQIGAYDSGAGSFNLVGGQGQIVLSAEGLGGDAISGTGTGGIGQGGRIAIDAKGAAIALGGNVLVEAVGEGGNAVGGTGGRAAGGSLLAHAFGRDLTISGNMTLLATAFGGNGRIGGLGQGGTVSAAADTASTLSVSGMATLDASALGGSGGVQNGHRGGGAQGGDASLVAGSGGSLAIGSLFLTAFAFGGGGHEGGAAQGGHGVIASTLGNIDINGDVFGFASATGGASDGANGGAATGGRFELIADGGTLDVSGPVSLETGALGGGTNGLTATGGSGTGGGLQVQARNGGTLTLVSALSASSDGHGGEAFAVTARAGNGFGGSVNLGAIGTSSTLDARGLVTLSADGVGGIAVCGECLTGAAGGNGSGGQAFVQTSGGNGNRILTGNALLISANGLGSGGYGGAGGNGLGGAASVFLADDARIAVAGGLGISARGDGGYQSNGRQAGAGTGGEALISLAGGATSLLTVGTSTAVETIRTTTLDSSGYGGSAGVVAGGIGGTGTGGWSHIYGTSGRATFAGNVVIEAEGQGGNGANGAGGAGIGGRARLNADGAAYRLSGTVAIVTDARGGDGRNGGAATLRAIDNDNNSGMFANNGGSIVVDGAATVSANAQGGGGRSGGTGGFATAGRANVVANGSATGNGSITLSRVTITADATGGNGAAGLAGSAGGNGGDATGGIAELATNNSASGTNRMTVGNAYLGALAQGGIGGRGGDGVTGARGGNGGIGTGGTALALSGAGNGAYSVTDVSVYADAVGGRGGDGGSGTTGGGGSGGAGGTGDGGFVVAGIASGAATPTTNSIFTAATLTGRANSTGGAGGNGGTGATGSGNGGNGGEALVSFNQLLARGGTVSVGTARMPVDARGGNGGSGAVAGNGGTAYSPNIEVIVTNRLNQPAAGARLTVGTLDFHGNAHAGTGATAGRALALGGPQLLVENSNAQFGSFSGVTIAADGIDPQSLPDSIRIINGTATVDNAFLFATDNRMSVLLDNGTLTAGTVTLDGANFERDATVPPPTTRGTISGGSFRLASGGAMIIDANLRSGGNVLIDVPGEVAIGNITAANDVRLDAGTTITLGDIASGMATAIGAVGSLAVGTIAAGGSIDLDAGGTLTARNATAGEAITFLATGALVAGNLSAGLVSDAVRTGASYNIGILSETSVTTGNVSARDWIGIGTRGALTAGSIDSRNDVLLVADGAITTGAITSAAQRNLLIAGADMVALGGPLAAFDRNRILAALGTGAEAATRGAVTIGGPVSSGTINALVGGDFTTGALTATSAAFATVGGTMRINGVWASPLSQIASNDMAIGGNGGIGGRLIDLISSNATRLLIGDGLNGSGYALDNAEFARLSAGNITVSGRSDTSAAIGALVGDLSLVGRAGGSRVTIATRTGGSLRVTGEVIGSGFGADDALGLAAGRVEIDATMGSIALNGSGGQIGGALSLVGQQIHVADGTILDRLALDPSYAMRDADLARASATQRPEGVIRAGAINVRLLGITPLTPYSVLVQNVGTSEALAGFTATSVGIALTTGSAPGPIDLNVYGQLVTPTTTLTGVAVRDALMANDNPARFTASSLINGCALTGACGVTPPPPPPVEPPPPPPPPPVEPPPPPPVESPPPPPPVEPPPPPPVEPPPPPPVEPPPPPPPPSVEPPPVDPQPAISTEIVLLTTPKGDDAVFGNEEAIEDNEEEGGEDSASSPIAAPVPLFNTQPLEQKSDTDEPVSGGGNPALIGSGRVEGEE